MKNFVVFFHFTRGGNAGRRGPSKIKFSYKKMTQNLNFKIFVFCFDAEQSINLKSSRSLLFLFHKRWKCVLRCLAIAASAWFIYISILIFGIIFLEFWKKIILLTYLIFYHGGNRGGVATANMKFQLEKNIQSLLFLI